MHTHNHHHPPFRGRDPFDAPRRADRAMPGGADRRRFRDPFAGPGPRRGRGGFGPGGFGPGGFGPQGGFDPEAAGAPFAPGFGPGRGRGGRGFGPDDTHGFRRGGHRRRAGRGDIRAAILLLLAEQSRHGYELIREIAERTEGTWHPSPGAIYPALALLEDEGLVTIAAEGGRRLASLSETGRAYVTAHADELGDPFTEATVRTPGSARALRGAIQGLNAAAWQLAVNGDDTQAEKAQAVVERATKDLYLLLAGEEPKES